MMRFSRFSIKVLLLAIVPALVMVVSFSLILDNTKSDINQYLSSQTKNSFEQFYRDHLSQRSMDLSRALEVKLEHVELELLTLAEYAQILIDNEAQLAPVFEQAKEVGVLANPLTYNVNNRWASSYNDKSDTVVALWHYLLNEQGTPTDDITSDLSRLSLMNPLMNSFSQHGASKSWVYLVGPKSTPYLYASPWAEIPEIFSQKYPGHHQHNWWDFFFPGLVDSWQTWAESGLDSYPNQITSTPIYDDAAGQGLMVTFFHPLWNKERSQNEGAVAIDFNIAQVINMIKKENMGGKGFTFLILDNGELIGIEQAQAGLLGLMGVQIEKPGVRTQDFNLFQSQHLALSAMTLPTLKGNVQLQELKINENDYLLSLQKVNSFQRWQGGKIATRSYFVAMMVPKNEIYSLHQTLSNTLSAEFDDSRAQLLFVALVLGGGVLLMAGVFSIRHTKQMHLLSQAATRIGQGDFAQNIKLIGNGDITELAKTFNEMSVKLAAMDQQQTFTHSQLQAQIEERKIQLDVAKHEAAHANKAKSQFLSNMSHEIRTPLTTISGYAEAILNQDINCEDFTKSIASIQTSSQHLLMLINDLLDLSKIEAHQVELVKSKASFVQLLHELEEYGKSRSRANGVSFQILIVYPINEVIETDITRLKQVLLNLLSNAFKFTSKGQVVLSVKQSAYELNFSVLDTGIGIAKENQERIFVPFDQTSAVIAQRYGGTGLGLSISQKLVSLFGGKLSVRSKINQGSEFSFNMPISSDEHLVDSKEAFDDIIARTKVKDSQFETQFSGHILLAEDHPQNNELISQLLKCLGFAVTSVFNGNDAVEKALQEDFDIILMDIQMPLLDGCEALALIQQAGVMTPVIALTANVLAHEVERYYEKGFFGCLAKPIERQKFTAMLNQALGLQTEVIATDKPILQPDQFQQLQQQFITSLHDELLALKSLLKYDDSDGVKKFSHRIKGAAAMFELFDLSQAFSELESDLKSNPDIIPLPKVNAALAQLESAIA